MLLFLYDRVSQFLFRISIIKIGTNKNENKKKTAANKTTTVVIITDITIKWYGMNAKSRPTHDAKGVLT